MGGLTLRVASRLPRYSDQYSLVLGSAAEHSVSFKRLWSRSPKCVPAMLHLTVLHARMLHGIPLQRNDLAFCLQSCKPHTCTQVGE